MNTYQIERGKVTLVSFAHRKEDNNNREPQKSVSAARGLFYLAYSVGATMLEKAFTFFSMVAIRAWASLAMMASTMSRWYW